MDSVEAELIERFPQYVKLHEHLPWKDLMETWRHMVRRHPRELLAILRAEEDRQSAKEQ